MAVSSYRKSFAFANTSSVGGKLLVLQVRAPPSLGGALRPLSRRRPPSAQAQDSHRVNLRNVQAQVDNGLPHGFGAPAPAPRPRPASAHHR